jgi:hypothetical protein
MSKTKYLNSILGGKISPSTSQKIILATDQAKSQVFVFSSTAKNAFHSIYYLKYDNK